MKKEDNSNQYQRLSEAIGNLPVIEPSPGWEQQLFEKLQKPRSLAQGDGITVRYTLLMLCVLVLNAVLLLHMNNSDVQPELTRMQLLQHASSELLITSQP